MIKKVITAITKALNYTDFNHGLNQAGNGWNWYNVSQGQYNMMKPEIDSMNIELARVGRRISHIEDSNMLILSKPGERDHKADIDILDKSLSDDKPVNKPGSWMK